MRARIFTLTMGMALAATAGLFVACRDTSTAPRDAVNIAAPAAAAAPQAGARAPGDARAELRRANPMDWVGAAHNATLDAFLGELRKPGILTRDICNYLAVFSAREEHIPAEHRALAARLGPSARRSIANKALSSTALCRSARSASASRSAHFARLSRVPLAAPQSVAANDLLSRINAAIDYATDAYDLAARLGPILDASASLPYEEYATIAATVSVAQSSYEYWQAELPAYQQAIISEYGACADQMQWSGYSYYDAQQQCMGGGATGGDGGMGGYGGASRELGPGRRQQEAVPLFVLTSTTAASLQCPTKSAGFQRIGRGDVAGAWAGAWAGAFSGGWQGALLGGIVGGGGASMAAAVGLVWDTMWYC